MEEGITSMAARAEVTIRSYENRELGGSVYSLYFKESIPFANTNGMLTALEAMFDRLSFPQSSVDYRTFARRRRKEEPCPTLFSKEADQGGPALARFIIHVRFRQNATWQGCIQWEGENTPEDFRSALELLKRIADRLDGPGLPEA